MKNILRNLKYIIFIVNKNINYLLFRFYSTEELMMNADSTMRAARNKRLEHEHQFMIPHPRETSWGKDQALDKERIIREFIKFTPVMNQRCDKESMVNIFYLVKVKRGPGLNSLHGISA